MKSARKKVKAAPPKLMRQRSAEEQKVVSIGDPDADDLTTQFAVKNPEIVVNAVVYLLRDITAIGLAMGSRGYVVQVGKVKDKVKWAMVKFTKPSRMEPMKVGKIYMSVVGLPPREYVKQKLRELDLNKDVMCDDGVVRSARAGKEFKLKEMTRLFADEVRAGQLGNNHIAQVFNKYDDDNSGGLSKDEIHTLTTGRPRTYSAEDVQGIVRQYSTQ